MTPELYQQLITRAAGKCECCGRSLNAREVDHFFSRAKAEESMETCWVLHPDCHFAKTTNVPSSAQWLLRFIAHCGRHGYVQAATRAQARLEWRETYRLFEQQARARA